MLVLEYKVKAKPNQYKAIDEAICTVQFIRNKYLRYPLLSQSVFTEFSDLIESPNTGQNWLFSFVQCLVDRTFFRALSSFE